MNLDFHYYGTYCAARFAGYEKKDAEEIAYYAQFVDECSARQLKKRGVVFNPLSVTVNCNTELNFQAVNLMPYTEDELRQVGGLWSAFHFLPGNLEGEYKGVNMTDEQKKEFRRMCLPDSPLVVKVVQQAKEMQKIGENLPAIGMTMHILADTWAHSYFAGIPASYINDIRGSVYEATEQGQEKRELVPSLYNDNPGENYYTHTPFNPFRAKSIVYLGHARIGHLPDYSFLKYAYNPVWDSSKKIDKDNRVDYMKAFRQMITAMKYIRGENPEFNVGEYAELEKDVEEDIRKIFAVRKADSEEEWCKFIEDRIPGEAGKKHEKLKFNIEKCFDEYKGAKRKNKTSLVRFLEAAKEHREFVDSVAGPYPAKKEPVHK